VSIITPTLFCDVRCAPGRPGTDALPDQAALDTAPLDVLAALARGTHAFCGFSDTAALAPALGAESADVCTRHIAIDWQPLPRLKPNRWRVDPRWDAGGWLEWSLGTDSHGQCDYVEHWRTLRGSREGPSLALRRLATGGCGDAYFLVMGNHFAYVADRPPGAALGTIAPGQGGHPADRGNVGPLVEAALRKGDRQALKDILALEAHYGTRMPRPAGAQGCAEVDALKGAGARSQGCPWEVVVSTQPWQEGTSLAWFAGGLEWGPAGAGEDEPGLPAVLTARVGGAGVHHWEVFSSTGLSTANDLRDLLSA